MLNCGDTFLIDDEEGYERHLWIVITPPTEDEDEVVIVSITTLRQYSETLVKLHQGDHSFIKHESVIAYSHAMVVAVEYIETAIKNGTAERTDPVTAALLNRVQAGLVESDRTPNGVKYFYRSVMGV